MFTVSSSFVLSFVPVNVDFIASIIVDIFDDCNEDLIYSKNDPDRVLFVVRERKLYILLNKLMT